MPFDGVAGLSLTNPKPSMWTRLSHFVTGRAPGHRAVPAYLLLPTPAADPDALSLQILTIGRSLIEDRKDWVQRRYETRDGRRCAVGALRAASRMLSIRPTESGASAFLLSVATARGYCDIESMNDNSTHRQVLSAFDEAIARASR
ncbi:DUF6197 family protein [Rhodopila sp.]|jgi:hypothetical protein|uniref:DUF6197 family protein n=1 Tax=Rhodopila sp. TaxID=2480087 RepID=UPI002BE0A573|nr:hypothetical protein [Rhodopila sp.]HVZ09037.1 hypothetical protein [Rhodopila sp.]